MTSHVNWWLVLASTVGSLVLAKSLTVRRSLNCEEQLQAVDVATAVCDSIRSAVTSLSNAVKDIDVKTRESTKDAIDEATEILKANTKLFKEQLPQYLPHNQESQGRVQEDKPIFPDLANTVAASAVSGVRNASKEIRHIIFRAIVELPSSADQISEATKNILGKILVKRSADDTLSDAMLKVGVQMKASMTKAVTTALAGFIKMVDNFMEKLEMLLYGMVHLGFFPQTRAQFVEVSEKASQDLVDYYDGLAKKPVYDAMLKIQGLLSTAHMVEKSTQNANALSVLIKIVETQMKGIKEEAHSQRNHEEVVAGAIHNAAYQMSRDYNDIVRIVNNA